MLHYFENYELLKLSIANINFINSLIIMVLFLICCLTLRKTDKTAFLDKVQTDQLKGLAILLVIVGHLWIHVSEKRCNLIFDESVALFLILSGFGLTVSRGSREFRLKQYFIQRIKRVMAPYWVATVLILALDYYILKKMYPFEDILLTLLGINISCSTKHIDYSRWYITLLLFWYMVFPVITPFIGSKKWVVSLFIFSLTTVLADYYIAHFDWYQILAFPAGCILGVYYGSVKKIFRDNFKVLIYLSMFSIIIFILYKLLLASYLAASFPSIAVRFVHETESILFSFAMITLVASMGYKRYYSKFLLLVGGVSYELFLLHGAFLIKYNPIISNSSMYHLISQFYFFLLFIVIIAMLFQKIMKIITEPMHYLGKSRA